MQWAKGVHSLALGHNIEVAALRQQHLAAREKLHVTGQAARHLAYTLGDHPQFPEVRGKDSEYLVGLSKIDPLDHYRFRFVQVLSRAHKHSLSVSTSYTHI